MMPELMECPVDAGQDCNYLHQLERAETHLVALIKAAQAKGVLTYSCEKCGFLANPADFGKRCGSCFKGKCVPAIDDHREPATSNALAANKHVAALEATVATKSELLDVLNSDRDDLRVTLEQSGKETRDLKLRLAVAEGFIVGLKQHLGKALEFLTPGKMSMVLMKDPDTGERSYAEFFVPGEVKDVG